MVIRSKNAVVFFAGQPPLCLTLLVLTLLIKPLLSRYMPGYATVRRRLRVFQMLPLSFCGLLVSFVKTALASHVLTR